MNKKNLSQTTTSIWRKIASVLLGLLLSLMLLEVGLRLGGFAMLSIQEYGNLRSVKQKSIYRILCLGESTTQGQYPHLLEKVLNQRNTGVQFSVIDKGIVGANTPAVISRVESYLAEYRPDMVVAMMGINDKGVRYYQDIPDSDTWLFKYCRVYRFGSILWMHILKQFKKEGIRKLNNMNSGTCAEQENARIPKNKSSANNSNNTSSNNSAGGSETENVYPNFRGISEADKFVKLDTERNNAHVESREAYRVRDAVRSTDNSVKKDSEFDPKDDRDYVELGLLFREQGKTAQAEDLFKRAIAINPKNDRACAYLGWTYQNAGEFFRAEDSFRKAIELNPKNDMAYFGFGWVYYAQGKFAQAEDLFKKAAEIDPGVTSFSALGGAYRFQGKFSQAEDSFRRAMACDPTDTRTFRAMSSLLIEMGKPELAKVYAEKANRLGTEYSTGVTVHNYLRLKELLDRKGIKLVCVQYPMREAEPLEKTFDNKRHIIFVDNERVFKEAVNKSGYKEYFRDAFGGDFGHCTQKGNELLAQNIANVILKEVFNK